MKNSRGLWRGLCLIGVLGICTAWILPQASATSTTVSPTPASRVKQLGDDALALEKQGRWADACQKYRELLREDGTNPEARQHLQQCYRHWQQVRRHLERTYRDQVARLKYSEVLSLYEGMLINLQRHYVDRTTPDRLFKRGLEEFRFGLENRVLFRYLDGRLGPREKEAVCRAFAAKLASWEQKTVLSVSEAVKQLREVAMAAQRPLAGGGLDLSANVVVMEFACGACAGLDEYTFYLTPGQFRRLTDSLKIPKGFIGVGLDLCLKDGRLVVARTLPRSPAEENDLKPDDQVLRIDGRAADGLTPEAATELLKGEVGTTVKVAVMSPDTMMEKTVLLKRRKLTPRSVEFGWLVEKMEMSLENQKPTDIGYVQILHFQKNTPQELDTALLYLRQGGMRGLILDLRGNPGGSFDAAVDCARRFLSSGVIVTTKGHNAKPTRYLVRNGSPVVPLAEDIPIAVLVDRDTASAAEVLAGALKDNKRATLVGRTTFGKVCCQKLFQLDVPQTRSVLGGMRVTVARFYSPSGLPYSSQGIAPHVPAERYIGSDRLEDHQLMEAKRLVAESMKTDPMPMSP